MKVVLLSLFLLLAQNAVAVEEIKIALIGDTEAGSNFGEVLKLVASEKVNAVMINGDFGYGSSPETWRNRVTNSIDTNIVPVIGSLGNHDVKEGGKYIAAFTSFRSARNGLQARCTGKTDITQGQDITLIDETCTFGNVTIISSGIGQKVLDKTYLEDRLEAKLKAVPSGSWKLVGYHYSLASMNPGFKGDQSTYRFFDLIRQYGAIGAQAHTHSAMASCPISSPFVRGEKVVCHPDFKDLESRFVAPGTGVYVDSSLGGAGSRDRKRCKNPNDKGCAHLIDLISMDGYTRTDGSARNDFEHLGALFLVFNAGGNPNKTHAYFKSVDGQTIFQFNVSR